MKENEVPAKRATLDSSNGPNYYVTTNLNLTFQAESSSNHYIPNSIDQIK